MDIESDDSYKNLAFTFVEKKLTFSGESVRIGDRIKFVVNSCDEADFNKNTTGTDYYTLDSDKSITLL